MTQEALDFGRLWRVDSAARRVYRHLQDAVDIVGVLPAAGACGIDRADLRRALDRDGRRIAVEHAMSIGALVAPASIDLANKLAAAVIDPFAAPPEPMTPEERANRLEVALRLLGPVGEQALAAALGGRR